MSETPDASDDELTDTILGRAIEVHRQLGRHQPEKIYREGLAAGLQREDLEVETEVTFRVEMYGRRLGSGSVDVLVEGAVVLELKVVRSTTEDHFWQLGRNVENTSADRGLLLNFGTPTLDIQRYISSPSER